MPWCSSSGCACDNDRVSARWPTYFSWGVVIDISLFVVLAPDELSRRALFLAAGVLLNGVAIGLYIALLDVAGAGLLVAVAVSHGWPSPVRRAVRGLDWIVGAGLLLVGLAGLIATVLTLVGVGNSGDFGPLAAWVFIVVYGAFLVVGMAFVATARLTRFRPA